MSKARLVCVLLIPAAIVFSSGCASYQISKDTHPVLDPALVPPMPVTSVRVYKDTESEDWRNIAIRSLHADAADSIYGFMTVNITTSDDAGEQLSRPKLLLAIASGISLTAINLVGIPMSWSSGYASVKVSVYDAGGQPFQTIRGEGNRRAYMGYFRYTEYGAMLAAPALALQDALAVVRQQLVEIPAAQWNEFRSRGPVDADQLYAVLSKNPSWDRRGAYPQHLYATVQQRMQDEAEKRHKEELAEMIRYLVACEVGTTSRQDFRAHVDFTADDKLGIVGVVSSGGGQITYLLGYDAVTEAYLKSLPHGSLHLGMVRSAALGMLADLESTALKGSPVTWSSNAATVMGSMEFQGDELVRKDLSKLGR